MGCILMGILVHLWPHKCWTSLNYVGAWGIFTLTLPGALEGKQTRWGPTSSHLYLLLTPRRPFSFSLRFWEVGSSRSQKVNWVGVDFSSFFSCLLLVAHDDHPPHPHPQRPVLSMCAHLDEGISDGGAKPTELWVKSNNTPWTGHKSTEWLTTTELQPWAPCLITLSTGWSSVCQHR